MNRNRIDGLLLLQLFEDHHAPTRKTNRLRRLLPAVVRLFNAIWN
jgi:hypothetical protein